MNALEIRRALGGVKHFIGVYAYDLLPERIDNYPASLIVNLDSHNLEGSHWISIYFDGCQRAYYFDSLALGFVVPAIKQFIKRNSVKLEYNKRRLQSLTSSTCGIYCILYIAHRTKKKSTKSFIKRFKKNCQENDKITIKAYKRFIRAKRKR